MADIIPEIIILWQWRLFHAAAAAAAAAADDDKHDNDAEHPQRKTQVQWTRFRWVLFSFCSPQGLTIV